jgi:hypothetical protein
VSCYRFVLGLDATQKVSVLTEFAAVTPKPSWDAIGEYRRARAQVGLD